MGRIRSLWLFLGLVLFAVSFYDVTADVIPSENECRPYIEKAIHELKNTEPTATDENESTEENMGGDASIETITTSEAAVESSDDDNKSGEEAVNDDAKSQEDGEKESIEGAESAKEDDGSEEASDSDKSAEVAENEQDNDSKEENQADTDDDDDDDDSKETDGEKSEEKTESDDSKEEVAATEDENITNEEQTADDGDSKEVEDGAPTEDDSVEAKSGQDNDEESTEGQDEAQAAESSEDTDNKAENSEDSKENQEDKTESVEVTQTEEDNDTKEEGDQNQTEESNDTKEDDSVAEDNEDSTEEEKVREKRSIPEEATPESENDNDNDNDNDTNEDTTEETDNETDDNKSQENEADQSDKESQEAEGEGTENESPETEGDGNESQEHSKQAESDEEIKSEEETSPEEELTLGFEIPKNLRSRTHISDLLGLDAESSIKENALKRTGDVILKELKRIYDNAIKPLETLYKYRELSNRHYGDPEIFSKPLIVFMGPYSGGKSTILNYLTDNEYTPNSIRSGAEPSPAYFNILMYGDEPEVLDGTQLAADWTFSGLQKFGQGLNDRLRGQKLPSKLLERVNIVEIPGILEVRKQVSRYFPFNDACQWFIDRADIIFLVYDPAKLDVGPETEAILDQLKGREYQTRILLNKGDQVKPEELLRVQSALIWNISPLMSSAQPPVMYTVSLWSHPYEQGSPVRLLQAQERAMLADLREAIDKRIENKIASARRFAVRIRNHAKMVDCYLTTYYNQKTLFSNKKQVSDKIIEHPQNYNIYEGLSTLTNISRYDLPDPEVYLDFFRLNPLYEFKKLSETCTYFKGCPINKLDIAIAYDLPELVGKYKKLLEENYTQLRKEFDENCNQSNIEPPVKLNSR